MPGMGGMGGEVGGCLSGFLGIGMNMGGGGMSMMLGIGGGF